MFSSSTEFEVGHSYKPWHVFAILQCGGDYKKAAADLSKLGFASKSESTTNRPYKSVSRDSETLKNYSEGSIKHSLDSQPILENAKQSLQEFKSEKKFSINEISPAEMWDNPEDPISDRLLGNRFLCREGSLLLVAQSGVGKPVIAMQMALNFALGKVLWGIDSYEPRKIVLIQAENNKLDLQEPFLAITRQMKLSQDEKSTIKKSAYNFRGRFNRKRFYRLSTLCS